VQEPTGASAPVFLWSAPPWILRPGSTDKAWREWTMVALCVGRGVLIFDPPGSCQSRILAAENVLVPDLLREDEARLCGEPYLLAMCRTARSEPRLGIAGRSQERCAVQVGDHDHPGADAPPPVAFGDKRQANEDAPDRLISVAQDEVLPTRANREGRNIVEAWHQKWAGRH